MNSLANIITFSRLLFLLFFIYSTQFLTQKNIVVFLLVLGLIFVMDCLDGFIARKNNIVTDFGAFFDIYADRAIETLLWFLFYFKGLIGLDVITVVVIRILTVDLIRIKLFFINGDVPFKQLKNKLSEFIVSNKIMKSIYGTLKLWVFSLLLYVMSLGVFPISEVLNILVVASVYLTLFFMVLRGLPVIVEYYLYKH